VKDQLARGNRRRKIVLVWPQCSHRDQNIGIVKGSRNCINDMYQLSYAGVYLNRSRAVKVFVASPTLNLGTMQREARK
jgi:hypothetical protein